MTANRVFFSYAHLDREADKKGSIETFYEGLHGELQQQFGEKLEHVFYDRSSIETGATWDTEIVEALQSAQVFLCLYSPAYFNSEYCGKEMGLFRERLRRWEKAKGQAPKLVQPVLWHAPTRLPSPLPEPIRRFQYTHKSYPDEYSREGLRYLMNRPKTHDEAYREFLLRLGERIVELCKKTPPPRLDPLPDLDTVHSSFSRARSETAERAQPGRDTNGGDEIAGPNDAQFVLVAGSKKEMTAVRKDVESYSDRSEKNWKPYLPQIATDAAIIAQQVATREGMHVDWLRPDATLVENLDSAMKRDAIVLIVVDPWTIRLERYQQFMREYDKRRFPNSAVLVPFNQEDQETKKNSDRLLDSVEATFVNRVVGRADPHSFRARIDSPEEFENAMATALAEMKMRVIQAAEIRRRAGGEEQVARPEISGPGGAG